MIGDLIGRHKRVEPEPECEPPSDLRNGPHKLCECGSLACGSPLDTPITEPRHLRA